MLTKILLSVALVAVFLSSTAYANFTQTITGSETYDTSLFGPGSDALELTTQATVDLTANTGFSEIVAGQEGALTFTLSGAVFATTIPNTVLTTTGSNATISVISGGAGSNSVQFGIVLGSNADDGIVAGEHFTFDLSTVQLRGASDLATAGATITITAAFEGTGNSSTLSGFGNRPVNVAYNQIATSADGLILTLEFTNRLDSDYEIADQRKFEETTGDFVVSETIASVGVVRARVINNITAADGMTNIAFGSSDAVRLLLTADEYESNNFASYSRACLSIDNDCDDSADIMGEINHILDNVTFVVPNITLIAQAATTGAHAGAHVFLLETNGIDPISAAGIYTTAELDFSTATRLDRVIPRAETGVIVPAGINHAWYITPLIRPSGAERMYMRFTNPGPTEATLFGIFHAEDGGQTRDIVTFGAIAPHVTLVLDSDDINALYNTEGLVGRSYLFVASTSEIETVYLVRRNGVLTQIQHTILF